MKRLKSFSNFGARLFLTAVFLVALVAGITSSASAASASAFGAVYTSTNAVGGNEVLVYNRSSDGSLVFQGSYPTNGLGSGASLGSQSALILSNNNHLLFAVDAGSHQISSFRITE